MLVKDKSAKKQSFFEAVESIKKEDGIAGFFRGLGPALMLVSNPVIQYTVYERLLVYFDGRRKLTPVDYLVLGAVAKLCATCVTYPYIVLLN